MDVKEYIQSGILEAYVLGGNSEQERREVECMSAIYPEIKEELNQLSKTLEQFALLYKVNPPAKLRNKILAEISKIEAEPSGRIVQLDAGSNTSFKSSVNYYKWIAAASVALLLLVTAIYQNTRRQLNRANEQLSEMQGINQNVSGKLNEIKQGYNLLASQFSIMSHCDMRIMMKGDRNTKHPCCLKLFCDGKTKEMYVQIDKLDPAPENQLYQLWAIVDDQPVDMGEIEITDDSLTLKPVKFVHHPQAFVLTLEENGYDTIIHEKEILAQVNLDHDM